MHFWNFFLYVTTLDVYYLVLFNSIKPDEAGKPIANETLQNFDKMKNFLPYILLSSIANPPLS